VVFLVFVFFVLVLEGFGVGAGAVIVTVEPGMYTVETDTDRTLMT
jgi:hypothetical protein